VKGFYLLIAAGGAVILFLCLCTTCICCCCCKKNKKKKKDRLEFNSFSDREVEKESLITKHPKTSARREELAKKYSFLRKDDPAHV
jgi:hypothetical protein